MLTITHSGIENGMIQINDRGAESLVWLILRRLEKLPAKELEWVFYFARRLRP